MLYQLWWRKKKVNFIIPPTYFRNNSYSIIGSKKSTIEKPINDLTNIEITPIVSPEVVSSLTTFEKLEIVTKPENKLTETIKVSALSLSSIRAKKDLFEAQKSVVKQVEHLPVEEFSETQMLEFWYKYAQLLNDKGQLIMESLLRISNPKLEGTRIIYELPNEGSKIDFEKAKPELLGYLRGHLHNHDITIDVIVNEILKSKIAFTTQDKFNRLKEINPNLEELRRVFDLDL